MRSYAFLLACYHRAATSVIVNIALKCSDAAFLCENAQLSRCSCPASCSCLHPAVHLLRGRLILRVPRAAHVMLVNMGTSSAGNIVLIVSHLPVRKNFQIFEPFPCNLAAHSLPSLSDRQPHFWRQRLLEASRFDHLRYNRELSPAFMSL